MSEEIADPDLIPDPFERYRTEYQLVKDMLRNRELSLSRAAIAVVLAAKKIGKYVNAHEVRKVLRELGYDFKDTSVNIALSKATKKGLLKRIRIGRISYYTIENNNVKDVIEYILLGKGIRPEVVRDIVEIVE
ncbi:MAG: hypothetical protein GXO43_03890 [Crenarchaeota archaeon]|nr:hypothetical protein [Thermoproteota archaeon]